MSQDDCICPLTFVAVICGGYGGVGGGNGDGCCGSCVGYGGVEGGGVFGGGRDGSIDLDECLNCNFFIAYWWQFLDGVLVVVVLMIFVVMGDYGA